VVLASTDGFAPVALTAAPAPCVEVLAFTPFFVEELALLLGAVAGPALASEGAPGGGVADVSTPGSN
jgi:hypothetical protein